MNEDFTCESDQVNNQSGRSGFFVGGPFVFLQKFFCIYTECHSETSSLQREANNCKPLCHLSSDSCLTNSSSFVYTGSGLESFPNILLPLYKPFPLDMVFLINFRDPCSVFFSVTRMPECIGFRWRGTENMSILQKVKVYHIE